MAADFNQVSTHLQEAETIARRPGVGSANFGHLAFGTGNVAIWRTMLAVEAEEGGRATEIARQVDPATLPESPSRRASWHITACPRIRAELGATWHELRAVY